MSKEYFLEIDSTKRGEKTVSLKKGGYLIDEIRGDIDLVFSIHAILHRNNLTLENDILEVVPNTGPGSFTGIKVGITIANTLNWQLGNSREYKPNYGGEPNINTP